MLKPDRRQQRPNTLQKTAEPPEPDLVDRIIQMMRTDLPALAEKLGQIESDIRAEFAGERCYIRGVPITVRQRRVSDVLGMLANGRNATTIARRLQIPRPTVYRIIKQATYPLQDGSMI